jgi:S-formylglutathione hydrolase FrmB
MKEKILPDIFDVFSGAMKKDIPCLVVKPSEYVHDGEKSYPSLYMLHGYSGDHTGFYEYMPDLQSLSDLYQIIFVCPSGGYNSWYLDSPFGEECFYETFISKELPVFIDEKYNTLQSHTQRAIMGLSMGGHGALYNAFRNPTVFGAAGSMSGGLDFTSFPLEWEIRHRLGDYVFNKKLWEENCVTNMIDKIPKDFPFIFDCGIDDFFMKCNRVFHEKLLKVKINHDYCERNGDHNWEYWANATRFQILYFNHFFNKIK